MRLLIYLIAAATLSASCAAHRLDVASRAGDQKAHVASGGSFGATLETSDGRLSAALLQLAAMPEADAHRRVAIEYRRLGVLDMAQEHFSAAVKLDPTDAFSYDALARIARDWGVPKMALADARHAVVYAPRSAAAANTLGTVYQALGEITEAKRWYVRALGLDPAAWYALNNLCYADIMTRESDAVTTCRRAVASAPDATMVRNNFALAHGAAGDLVAARQWFRRAGDAATANYNYGILMMSTRAYREAEQAFQSALMSDPEFTLAASRARQARLAALAEEHTRDSH